MTYKDIVDRIADAVDRHKMLSDFGYGQVSDIKVLDQDGDGADYPYAFLVPTGVARNQSSVTYSFSMIVMEMAQKPSEILQVQSDCMQYINDIVADLRFSTFSGDVSLVQSIQVFRERFQDEVAGATLNLQVTVADQIDQCTAPFAVEYVPETAGITYVQTFENYVSGTNGYFAFNNQTINDATKFYDGPFSQVGVNATESFKARIKFTGAWEYNTYQAITPSEWQLALHNTNTGEFIGLAELPSGDGTVEILSDTFDYPVIPGTWGIAIYKKGTANPNTTPTSESYRPIYYSGTFEILV